MRPDRRLQGAQLGSDGIGEADQNDIVVGVFPQVFKRGRYGYVRPMVAAHGVNGYRDIHWAILSNEK